MSKWLCEALLPAGVKTQYLLLTLVFAKQENNSDYQSTMFLSL